MEDKDRGAELGKKLGRAFRLAKPRARRLAEEARPQVERGLNEALKFAREHEDEGKQIASRLVRARLTGPLGMAFDALASQAGGQQAPNSHQCSDCQTKNPLSAKFCSQCGNALAPG